MAIPIAEGTELTCFDTVAAGHTTTVIHGMVLIVDAGSLAVLGTQTAVLTFFLIEVDLQQGKTTKEAQESTNRTDRVAIGPSASPCQNGYDDEGDRCDNQCGYALDPGVHMVESITVEMLGDGSQNVVSCLRDRLEQVDDNASIGAVWR